MQIAKNVAVVQGATSKPRRAYCAVRNSEIDRIDRSIRMPPR